MRDPTAALSVISLQRVSAGLVHAPSLAPRRAHDAQEDA